jgi:hypothetical protein
MHTLIKQIPKRPRLRPVCEFTTANHRDGATAYDPEYDSEYFSNTYDGQGDIPFAKNNKMDGYLATPSGKIKYYNYVNDTITRLQ